VLLRHLCLKCLTDELHFISVGLDALLFDAIDVLVVHVFHTLCNEVSDVDMARGYLLGCHNIHILQLFDKSIKLLDIFLILVCHHLCNVLDLSIEVRASNIKMLVSNLMEQNILVGEYKVSSSIIRHFFLLSYFLVWVYNCIGYRDAASLDSVEFIK